MNAEKIAVIAFCDDGTAHQVWMNKEKTALTKMFLQSLFDGPMPVSPDELPLRIEDFKESK